MTAHESRTGDPQEKFESKPVATLKCDEIRDLLTDYMTRELGEGRSSLVREHLRKCPACRGAAQEMARALELLRASGGDAGLPRKLSASHRARIERAFRHPVLAWIELHHNLVSILIAAVLVLVTLAALIILTVVYDEEEGPSIPIRVIPTRQAPGTLEDVPDTPPAGAIEDRPEETLVPLVPGSEADSPPAAPMVRQPPGDDQPDVAQPSPLDPAAAEPADVTGGNTPRPSLLKKLLGSSALGWALIGTAFVVVAAAGAIAWRLRRSLFGTDGVTREGRPPFK